MTVLSAFSMHALNRTAMAKRYGVKWVALKGDRKTVVASGTTAEKALRAAQKKGVAAPVIYRMPKEIHSFIGGYRPRV